MHVERCQTYMAPEMKRHPRASGDLERVMHVERCAMCMSAKWMHRGHVIPAYAGIQSLRILRIPAYAGMTIALQACHVSAPECVTRS